MEQEDSKILKILKKIKSSDILYLGVVFIFFTIVAILFFYSTNFIIANINKIFSSTNLPDVQALDLASYSLVAKKLNLPANTETINADTVAPATVPDTTIAPLPTAPVAEAPIIDKKSINIIVLNITGGKKGAASILAKALEDDGFSTPVAGNTKQIYKVTTIIVNENKREYAPLIEEVVKKSYPDAVMQIFATKSNFDATIVIGRQ